MHVQIVVVNAFIVRHACVEVGWILPAEPEGPTDVAVNGNKDGHSHRPSMRTNIRCLLTPVASSLHGSTADEIVSVGLAGIVYLRDLVSVS